MDRIENLVLHRDGDLAVVDDGTRVWVTFDGARVSGHFDYAKAEVGARISAERRGRDFLAGMQAGWRYGSRRQ